MPAMYQSYNAFLSSPSDVMAERQMAEESVLKINDSCKEVLGLSLEVKMWEKMPPETPHIPEEQIQDRLNTEIGKAHFFILVLYRRYGTVEAGHTKSNTEREVDTIIERYKKNPQLKILAYFRETSPSPDPGDQEKKIAEFKERLQSMGIMYRTYSIPEQFKDMFTHDLYNIILRMRLSPFKQQRLKNFWQFGESERPTRPRLAIIFPPVQRQFMSPGQFPNLWFKRLAPNVYFEDYKALHKIEKDLHLIGFREFAVYGQTDTPTDLSHMNRAWLCLSRNLKGIQQLKRYQSYSRFRFVPEEKRSPARVFWKTPSGDQVIEIHSPLYSYLKVQRESMDTSGEWYSQLGKIVAKDFAVLARFKDLQHGEGSPESHLQDYFITGIRGLGTWGAAWFIDRMYKLFQPNSENDDIAMLLEVTYVDDRIHEVRVVSEEPPEYFNKECTLRVIRSHIAEHRL